jgi:general secretion pathway protein F
MPDFRYRALAENGKIVSGVISAPTAAEVARRIDYLKLVPIDDIVEQRPSRHAGLGFTFGRSPRPEDVTIFTLDLALLLKAGARLDDALELLANDIDIAGLRSTVGSIRSSVLSGETFADAIAHYPSLFPDIYVALVRVGEASGMLEHILHVLARERLRAEALRRRVHDAVRYPLFVLFAAICVLLFFLMFVLPQFSAVLRDFGAELDPMASFFVRLSEWVTAYKELLGTGAIVLLGGIVVGLRHHKARVGMFRIVRRLPVLRTLSTFHKTALFCRNLDVLLVAAVPLTTALRILADMMSIVDDITTWTRIVDKVRHGGKLSEGISEAAALPAMAIRMLRLGEETGQLAVLAGRVADFYETKLQRSLERVVALVGPLAIVAISIIVGGLIVSVMTSLLSVSQLVG